MTTTQTHTFAWCENGDHAHDRCRTTYTGGNGVEYRCSCVGHTERQESSTTQGDSL